MKDPRQAQREGAGEAHFYKGGDMQSLFDYYGKLTHYCDYETGYLEARDGKRTEPDWHKCRRLSC